MRFCCFVSCLFLIEYGRFVSSDKTVVSVIDKNESNHQSIGDAKSSFHSKRSLRRSSANRNQNETNRAATQGSCSETCAVSLYEKKNAGENEQGEKYNLEFGKKTNNRCPKPLVRISRSLNVGFKDYEYPNRQVEKSNPNYLMELASLHERNRYVHDLNKPNQIWLKTENSWIKPYFNVSSMSGRSEENNHNFISKLRTGLDKESHSESPLKIIPNSRETNNHYPVNDDAADFAEYIKRKKYLFKERVDKVPSPSSGSRDEIISNDVNTLTNDLVRNMNDPDEMFKKNLPMRINLKSLNGPEPSSYNIYDGMNEINQMNPSPFVSNRSDLVNAIDDLSLLDKQDDPRTKYGSSLDKLEDSNYNFERKRADNNWGFIRNRIINLQEPISFNSTHVISSFIYSMIPFRSPLLNLLESDTHSKYIMIKIDPVLKKSCSANNFLDYSIHDQNSLLERKLISLIDKSLSESSVGSATYSEPKSKINRFNQRQLFKL